MLCWDILRLYQSAPHISYSPPIQCLGISPKKCHSLMDFSLLVDAYFRQLTRGCDSFSCENEFCAACRRFKHSSLTVEARETLANMLAREHETNPHLCPYYRDLVDPGVLECCGALCTATSMFMKEGRLAGDTERVFRKAFSSIDVLGYMFSTNPFDISQNDMAIDIASLSQFIAALKRTPARPKLDLELGRICEELKRSHLGCGHHIRALILVLCLGYCLTSGIRVCFEAMDMFALLPNSGVLYARKNLLKYHPLLPMLCESCKQVAEERLSESHLGRQDVLLLLGLFASILGNINGVLENPYPVGMMQLDRLTGKLEQFLRFDDGAMSPVFYPQIMPLSMKRALLKEERDAIQNDVPIFNITIQMRNFWDELMVQLNREPIRHLTRKLKLQTIPENVGRDPKVVLSEMVGQVVKQKIGLVIPVAGPKDYFWFKYMSNVEQHRDDIDTFSAAFVLACFHQFPVPVKLHPIIFRIMKGHSVRWHDLCSINEQAAAVIGPLMRNIMNNKEVTERIPFVLPGAVDGAGGPIPLKDNGLRTLVDNQNYEEFIDLCIEAWFPQHIRRRFMELYDELLGTTITHCLDWTEMEEIYYGQ